MGCGGRPFPHEEFCDLGFGSFEEESHHWAFWSVQGSGFQPDALLVALVRDLYWIDPYVCYVL